MVCDGVVKGRGPFVKLILCFFGNIEMPIGWNETWFLCDKNGSAGGARGGVGMHEGGGPNQNPKSEIQKSASENPKFIPATYGPASQNKHFNRPFIKEMVGS